MGTITSKIWRTPVPLGATSTVDDVGVMEAISTSIEWPDPETVPNCMFKGKRVTVKTIKVYDGDTITVLIPIGTGDFAKTKIRIMGVDSPELKVKRTSGMTRDQLEMAVLEEQAGDVVREKVSKLLLNKEIEIKVVGPDKYNRLVGAVYLKTQKYETLTEYLLANNLGKAYGGGFKGEWTRVELQAIIDQKSKPRATKKT